MRTSEEKVAELHLRMRERRHEKARGRYLRACASAAAICLALTVVFAAILSQIPVHSPGELQAGAMASMISDRAVLGFLLVALVAFFLGVFFTAFCYRMRKRMEEEEKRDEH